MATARCEAHMLDKMTHRLDFLGNALTLRAERQRTIASNIANADTPGYVARDFNFSEALREATGHSSANGTLGSPKLAAADGPNKATVQKEMIGKMSAAVQASGLSPDKYNEMSAAVQKDNALRQRLTQVLNAEPAA